MSYETSVAAPPASPRTSFTDAASTARAGWFRRKRRWLILGIIVVVVLLLAVPVFRGPRPKMVNYVTKPATQGSLRQTVDATGTIQAVTTVQVGSQVSGTISRLLADFNSHVTKGQLIAEIDPRVYEGNLLQSRADLENARANLAAAKANLINAQAKAAQAQADYDRTKPLGDKGIVSPQQVDSAKASAESAAAQVSANQSIIRQAQAQVQQREAAVKNAETNLAYTNIHAPIDGTVINRAVDLGQTVAASFNTPTLFTIAQDLSKMQLHVSTNEGDIGSVRVGLPVTFRVDAFPGEIFQGRVSQVRMNATTVQNVVTYETIVDFDNPDLKLFPGMTAYVTIPVQSVDKALLIPSAALRFNPDKSRQEVEALMKKYNIEIPKAGAKSNQGAGSASTGTAVIWKLRPDKTIEPVLVRTGLTDHTQTAITEVLKGTLSVGDPAITAEAATRSGFGPPPR